MRPAGEVRRVLEAALAQEHGTSRDLAARAQHSIDLTRRTLDNMVRGGAAAVVATIPVPGVRRPVPVYGAVGVCHG